MIDNCKDCTTKCCRSGPGPYTVVSFRDWFTHSNTARGYNTACEHFKLDETCSLYGTASLPIECQTYVCGVRTFTVTELQAIKRKELDHLIGETTK